MELSRRGFVRRMLAGLGLAALGGFCMLSSLVPERFRRAVPGRRFPGSVRPLGRRRTFGPGRWAG